MLKAVDLKCAYGAVKGKLKIVPGSFFHVQCLCCDCQSFASHLNNAENILDAHGGTELFQTYPAYMEITKGQDKIRCMQLTSKGLYRWHTSCCHMPLANTMRSAKVPFVGISVKLMQFASKQEKNDILGPITIKAFGEYAIGDMPEDTYARFPLSYIPMVLWFMFKGMLTQNHQPSPFFKDGKPVVEANILS